MSKKTLIVALDFDGTVVKHDYPRIGEDIGAVPWLRKLQEEYGVLFVLNTMRSGPELEKAVQWFKRHDIPLYGVNENPTQKEWTESPKVYAHVYVDDAALGCPCIRPSMDDRPWVDWSIVGQSLIIKARERSL